MFVRKGGGGVKTRGKSEESIPRLFPAGLPTARMENGILLIKVQLSCLSLAGRQKPV